MAVTKLTYAADAAVAVTAWESLGAGLWATSANVDNTTNLYMDMLVGGEIAATATTITAGESFDIYVAARYDKDVTTSYSGGIGALLAAGGAEIIASILSMENKMIHPTINYETPDPECDLDYVPNKARSADINCALSNSLGFGGHNATIIVKKYA